MKGKIGNYTFRILSVVMLVAGLVVGSMVAVVAQDGDSLVEYEVNDNGQTYGYVQRLDVEPSMQEYPELIAAIGIDGIEGYVYLADLDGDQPSNPDEAIVYMQNLETEIQNARAAGSEYLRYIPLYENDGVTVKGQFGISYPGEDISLG